MNKQEIKKIAARLNQKFGGKWIYIADGENEIFQLNLYSKYLPGVIGRYRAESITIEYDEYNEAYSLHIKDVQNLKNRYDQTQDENEVISFINEMPSNLPHSIIHP